MSAAAGGCPLCEGDAGRVVARTDHLRVIRVAEAGFPAFYRVVWDAHVAEWSDLQPWQRQHCMDAVVGVEQVLRHRLAPTKVNLASLGNLVPHLHWHVIARFAWDSHWPAPVWAAAVRTPPPGALADTEARLPGVDEGIAQALRGIGTPGTAA